MQITRTSMVSGQTRTLDLPITAEQVGAFNDGALVQNAFPHLTNDQREFFLSGITAEEWDAVMSDDASDDDLSEDEDAF